MTTFEIIKKLSKEYGITVKNLSAQLGFGEGTIYKWKYQSPKAADLEKVATFFNVSTDYLLSRTDNPYLDDIPQEAATIAAHIDPDATEEDMKKILEYIDFIQQKYK
ncbi:helix-turn-helix domain-containing protein [Listeria innocua]|uniref:helix-turn-helix domain-containing protein n=1 Tax=Listeria innocua TaxID=1642 RepID=UPI001626EDF0|nr:helix-turn-helix transcriptional regulator [Listeria innocua]MBC2238356.1 helix-turn-helix transcriptional regulator [Listeria innocua]